MIVLCGCGITVSLMHTLVAPLLPEISHTMHLSQDAVSWLLTVTMLAGAVCAPVCGRLGDMFGKRRMLAVALAIMSAGSLLGAVSWSFESLLGARMLQGAAFGVLPLGISILKDELPADRVMAGTATMSSTLGVGGAIGMPLAGVIAQLLNWHAVFWAATAVSLLAFALVVLFVPESPVRSGGRFDVVGSLGLAAGLVSLLMAVSRGGTWGWGSPATIGLFAGAAVVLVLWAVHQLWVRQPLVDLRTSARPVVLLTNTATTLVGVGMFASFMMTPLLLQASTATGHGFGASVMVAGLCMVPMGLGMLFFSPLSAKLSARRGAHVTLLVGTLVLVVGNVAQALMPGNIPLLMVVLMVVSIGTALCFSAMPTLIMAWVPATETASANSVNSLLRTIGTSTCAAIGGTFLAAYTIRVDGTAVPSTTGFAVTFWMAAGACAGAAGLALAVATVIRRSARRAAEETGTVTAHADLVAQ
ncbi:MFS transporter [Actinophytocola algeriensis]|uniref:MFS family permease n=1 Tax=Actinophytocola algeriensis TaxID=1768010 RepID=A0A7W7Q7P1_9PSEU|nr:MFS transporter [Actinophytocola algeriensis]MBB4908570.1 MFS family permease [Actinophytocola algeriensis]MBE1475043.1 MFS family permease [Actinophytocola algeriensis]